MADSSNAIDVSAPTPDLKFMLASNVNFSTFVSVKLSGRNNYNIWKAQMLCLIKSQVLLHLIDDKYPFPGDKGVDMIWQYDQLVKGWIFGSLNEKVLNDFAHLDSAREVWMELESHYDPRKIYRVTEDSVRLKFGIELIKDVPEKENTRKRLYKAAVEGCWWKAKSILKVYKNAATEAITQDGNTILHIAVERGHNYFVEKLLGFLKDGKDIEKKNDMGQTALHIAAMVGNTHAAQLLVHKRKELSVILDSNKQSPLDISYANMMLDIPAYLLTSDLSSYPYNSLESAIFSAILTKNYDLARTLLDDLPHYAWENKWILKAITITFPNDLGFTESFIYPSFHNICRKTVMRISWLFHYNILDVCLDYVLRALKIYNNTCNNWWGKNFMILLATLYPIYQLICLVILVLRLPFSMLYFLMWKAFAVTVDPIKNIEKKKNDYKEAKEILSLICSQMGPSHDGYGESIIEAVRQGTYEVVDEILFTSPETINCKDDEGHNIIQLTIVNRSEKVYNLIYHIIETYRRTKDSSMNNLAHLAGRLAPSFVLDRTTGAALQLQRELRWRKEVEKIMLPLELREKNIYMETPTMMFTREHKDLIRQGESWMKTTAESCNITAALIVTIVFAATITVPGGSDQETGIPLFKKENAFTIFAVFNAFSLFTAATSLLLFLSILTARFSERDFLVSLPRRLILGLFTLFLSTTAMIVAFVAILFLVICDQRPWMLAPICVFACLPISVIVTIKLPLLLDLIQSTYSPIFGKQGYLGTCKINQKNTIYFRERKNGDLEDQLMS